MTSRSLVVGGRHAPNFLCTTRSTAAVPAQHAEVGFNKMQPAEHFRKNSKTVLLPGLSYVHRQTKEELRYGDIKMRKVKSTGKILNNITSKWLKFYFQWERN